MWRIQCRLTMKNISMSRKDGESGEWSLPSSEQGLGLADTCSGLFCEEERCTSISLLFNVYIVIEGLFPNSGHQEGPKGFYG